MHRFSGGGGPLARVSFVVGGVVVLFSWTVEQAVLPNERRD